MREESSAKETITEIEAAVRQIKEAVRLHFERRDCVGIHTLAAAAHGVLRKLCRKQGIESAIFDTFKKFIRPDRIRFWNDTVRRPQNFFKHGAARNGPPYLTFSAGATTHLMFDAVLMLYQLSPPHRTVPEIEIFRIWYLSRNPEIVGDEAAREVVIKGSRINNPDDYEFFLTVIDDPLTRSVLGGSARARAEKWFKSPEG